jgi:hypothetical protein
MDCRNGIFCVSGRCGVCRLDNTGCNQGDMRFCDPSSLTCVQCFTNAQCTGNDICAAQNQCVGR